MELGYNELGYNELGYNEPFFRSPQALMNVKYIGYNELLLQNQNYSVLEMTGSKRQCGNPQGIMKIPLNVDALSISLHDQNVFSDLAKE